MEIAPKAIRRLSDLSHDTPALIEYRGEIYVATNPWKYDIGSHTLNDSRLWLRRTRPWQGIYTCLLYRGVCGGFTGVFGGPDEITRLIQQIDERNAWFEDPRHPRDRGPCPPNPTRTASGRPKRFRPRPERRSTDEKGETVHPLPLRSTIGLHDVLR